MNADAFWTLIEHSRRSDVSETERDLVSALATRPPDEIGAFNLRWLEALFAANTWDLVAAALLLNGGVSDDGFEYFRDWLVLQGRQVFDAAVADPDSLAEVVPAESMGRFLCEYECYPASDALIRVTGQERGEADDRLMGDAIEKLGRGVALVTVGAGPTGRELDLSDDAEIRQRLPRLTARAQGDPEQ